MYTDFATYGSTEEVLQGLGIPLGHFKNMETDTKRRTVSRIREHFEEVNAEAKAMNLPKLGQRRQFHKDQLSDDGGIPEAHPDQIDPGRRGKKNRGTRVLDMLNDQPVIPGEFYNDFSRIPKARWTQFVRQWDRIKTKLARMARIFMGPTWGMTFIMGFQFERNLVIEIWYNSATSMFNVYDQNGAALATPSLTLQESIQFFVTHLLQTSDVDEEVFKGNSNKLARSYMNSLKQAGMAAADFQRRDYLNKREKSRQQSNRDLAANAPAENAAYRERLDRQFEKDEEEAEKARKNSVWNQGKRATARGQAAVGIAVERGIERGKDAIAAAAKTASEIDEIRNARKEQEEKIAKNDAELARQSIEDRTRKQQERIDSAEKAKKEAEEAARVADNIRRSEQRKRTKELRDIAADIQKRTGKFTTANMVAQAKARTQLGEAETDVKRIMRALNKIREEKKALDSVKNTDSGKRAIANKEAAIRETEKELTKAEQEVRDLKAKAKKLDSEKGKDKPEGLNESIQVLREFQPRGTRGDKFFTSKAFQVDQNFRSREMILYMHPQTFLKLADPIQEKERSGSQKKTDGVKSVLTSGEKFDTLPYMRVDRSRGGIAKVVSHDGRHRAMALNEIGVDSIPVRFESENIRWGSQTVGSPDWVDEWPEFIEAQQGSFKVKFPVEREDIEVDGMLNESISIRPEYQPRQSDASKFFTSEALSDARRNTGFKSRYILVSMSPDRFLELAKPGMDMDKFDDVTGILDSGEKFNSVPFLTLGWVENGSVKVTGHEGRHRARAIRARGGRSIPVLIRSSDIRWTEQIPGKFDYIDEWPQWIVSETGSRFPFPVEREESIQENTDLSMMFGDDGSLAALQTIDREVVSIRKMAENQNTTGQIGELMETMLTTYETTRVRSTPVNMFKNLFRGRRLPIEQPITKSSTSLSANPKGIWNRIKQMFGYGNRRADFIVGFSLREEINIEVWYVTEVVRGLPTSSFYVYDVTADRIVRGNLPYYRSAIQIVLAKIGVS